MRHVRYDEVAEAVQPTGMAARGGFLVEPGEAVVAGIAAPATRAVVVIGNIGGAMWPHFRAADPGGRNPLDMWTRNVLLPIADRLGAAFVHPSDEPFQPFQRWAQRADDVWQSPIGLLIHPTHGLWHAYRGAFLFPFEIDDMPAVGLSAQPCLTCADQPCLSTCPVDAFTIGHYAADACRAHVRGGGDPTCGTLGCAARLACPVGADSRYESDQMQFHMRAFIG